MQSGNEKARPVDQHRAGSSHERNTNPTTTPYHASDGTASEFLINGLADTATRSFFSGTNLVAAQEAEASTNPCVWYRTKDRVATARECREVA